MTRGKPIIKDNEIVKFIGSVLDITERKQTEKQLREAKDYLENVLENSPDGIGIVDKNGNFFKWNNAAAELYGFSYEELSGKSFTEFYPDAEKLSDMLKLLRQNGFIRKYEIEMLMKDRRTVPFELSISLLKDEKGTSIGSVCMARDLSETKKTLTELTTAYEKLQQTKEAAEAANKAKSAFLANMSHELRTPLNAIIGFSELMTRDQGLSQAHLKDLATIVRSGEYLLSLINDVLEFSKIEAGRIYLNKDNFDLHRLLNGLEEMFHLKAQQKRLNLNLDLAEDVPRVIRADQSKLRQILINLIGNSIKFTQTGGITLRVSCSKASKAIKPNNCSLCFDVIDTGTGISKHDQDHVFEAFQTGDQQSHQGTGLGLPISQKFVTMMGGTLEVSSNIGQGSCFTFTIQVELAEGNYPEISAKANVLTLAEEQPAYRLLVVEDNDNNRNLLVRVLQTVGFEVQEAINGQEAIEAWKQWQPDLIWMDIRMPVMNGYKAIKHIRKSPKGNITKIIALTASAFEEDRLKVLKYGGNDFVRKPFREAEIFEILEKHLGVKFIYKETIIDKVHSGQGISHEKLQSIAANFPDRVLTKLAEATELSDAAMIEVVIEEVRALNPTLADALSALADNYAYDEILTLIKGPATPHDEENA